MKIINAIAIAAVLSASSATVAFADSPMSALGSASSVSFETVFGPGLLAANRASANPVDLDSLKARISQAPRLMAQLSNYGASINDVVGITGTDETDVTILVRG